MREIHFRCLHDLLPQYAAPSCKIFLSKLHGGEILVSFCLLFIPECFESNQWLKIALVYYNSSWSGNRESRHLIQVMAFDSRFFYLVKVFLLLLFLFFTKSRLLVGICYDRFFPTGNHLHFNMNMQTLFFPI